MRAMAQLPENRSGNRLWFVPWLLPLAIIAVIVCATVLPGWAFIPLGGLVVLVVLPLVWRTYSAGRDTSLPDWLPGSRPGDR